MKLVICNIKPSSPTDFYYIFSDEFIDEGDELCLNNAFRLNQIALEVKERYVEYVASLNTLFLDEGLILENTVSIFHFTEVSNKRTESSNTFHYLCHVNLISALVSEHNIEKVEIMGIDKVLAVLISNKIPSEIQITITSTKKPIEHSQIFLSQLYFAMKATLAVIMNLFSGKSEIGKRGLFLYTVYPMGWKENKDIRHGYSVSDSRFIYSLITDGMHQGLTLKHYIKHRIKNPLKDGHSNLLLDRYLSMKSLVIFLSWSIQLYIKMNRIRLAIPFFEGLPMKDLLKDEFVTSILRVPRLLMLHHGFKRLLKQNSPEEFHYHLFEYSYGRMMTSVFKMYSQGTKLVGYQHGPVSKRKLLISLSENEVSKDGKLSINHVPIPDNVVVENTKSKVLYFNSGYKNIIVRDYIPRLFYLKGVDRTKVQKKSTLVACGLHDGECLFYALFKRMQRTPEITYYFKLHPRSNKEFIRRLPIDHLSNLVIAKEEVSVYLDIVDHVICTYSSVGEEAFYLGIETEVVLLNQKINESSLLD